MNIASLNINGGRSELRRLQTVQLARKEKIDILLLQETRATPDCMADWQQQLNGTWFFSNTDSVSVGIAFFC